MSYNHHHQNPRSSFPYHQRPPHLTRTRPEDAQPSESVQSNIRPAAPPQLVTVSSQPYRAATSSSVAGAWAFQAGASRSSVAGASPSQPGRSPAGLPQRPASATGFGARVGPSSGLFIRPPRSNRSKSTTAGGWATGSNSINSLVHNSKGKEPQREPGAGGAAAAGTEVIASSTSSSSSSIRPPVPIPIHPRPKLWISSLPTSVTEDELRTVFSPFGEIEDIKITPRKSISYAHIMFSSPAYATVALQALNGQPFPSPSGLGSSRPLKIVYWTSADERSGGGARTVEMPAALFRERETPEPSQSQVKGEELSPVKSVSTAATPSGAPRPSPDPTDAMYRHSPNFARITAPIFTYRGQPLRSYGEGERGAAPGDHPSNITSRVYSIRYHLPPNCDLAALKDELTAQAVAKTFEMLRCVRRQPKRRKGYPPPECLFVTVRVPPILLDKIAVRRPGKEERCLREEDRAAARRGADGGSVGTSGGGARVKGEGEAAGGDEPEKEGEVEEGEVVEGDRSMAVQESEVDQRVQGVQDDGTFIERIPLPPDCVGDGPDAAKGRTMLRIAEVKKRSMEGKVVLSSTCVPVPLPFALTSTEFPVPSFRIDEAHIVINYVLDDVPASIPQPSPPPQHPPLSALNGLSQTTAPPSQPPHQPAPRSSTATATPSIPTPAGPRPPQQDVQMLDVDVKPVIPGDADMGEADMEIDQLATPTPEPEPVRFPLAMLRTSRADSLDTYQSATAFMKEYFRRFDQARSTLEHLYTPNALFSIKVDPHVPARLHSPPAPFSRRWLECANKTSSTPTAITNAIRELPTGSHDLDRMVFNARSVPEFHLRRDRKAPILVHLTGEFEEFPEHVVRTFQRTFVIVPSPRGNAAEGPTEFLVHSDQLIISHKVSGEPRALDVAVPPFSPSKDRQDPACAPPPVQSHQAVRPLPQAGPPAQPGRPFAQLQRHQQTAPTPPQPVPSPPAPQPQRPQSLPQQRSQPQPQAQSPPPPQSQLQPRAQTQPQPIASTSASVSRSNEKRRRPSGSTASAHSTSSSPAPPSSRFTTANVDGDVLVISDSDSSTASHSPELSRPSKRPNLGPSAPPLARAPLNASTGSAASAAVAPAPASRQSDKSLGKRRAADDASGSASIASSTASAEPATAYAGLSRAEIEQLIEEQLEKRLEERLAREVERLAGGRAQESDAEARGPKGAKKGKSKENERDKGKETENEKGKSKIKEKTKVQGLGTGLSAGDARIVLAGMGNSVLHSFDGRSNKLRGMAQASEDSFLAVSFIGDIAEWKHHPSTSVVSKLYASKNDVYRVDDFAYSAAKETLIVGYLGAKDGKELASPPSQVVLYKREIGPSGTTLVETRLPDAPHLTGGVTALMALPAKASTDRLRFVTAGEDKKVFLWSRARSTQKITTEKFRTEHTSQITGLSYLEGSNQLVSGGKDKRVVTYDMETRVTTWQALLTAPVMSVSPILCDPNLLMARISSPSNQFSIHDLRLSSTSAPVLNFGIDLAPHRSTTGALTPTNMGRYLRGDQCDTVFVFPDGEQGVKMWDLRNLRTQLKKQDLGGLGRSKGVQASFRGRSELCLMEMSHFTRVTIRG
ncbi:hypothetical protein JCM1840_003211 [Sporobolomyces johnsonii]